MDLYLVRHAIAEPHSPGVPDEARVLTREGRKRFRRCVRGLDRLGVRLDRLLFSPLARAVQTAEEMAPLLEGESAVTPLLAEAPSAELLEEIRDARSCALVGHEPWMSALLGLLIGAGGAPSFAFKKGGAAWLRGEPRPGGMELRAFLPPRVLVALAES